TASHRSASAAGWELRWPSKTSTWKIRVIFQRVVARRLQPSDGRSPEGFALRRLANRSKNQESTIKNSAIGIRVARAAIDAVVAHARSAAPDECCGLLLGAGDSVVDAQPARNADDWAIRGFDVDQEGECEWRPA